MFRIRRIFDDNIAIDRQAVDQVLQILRNQFPLIDEEDVQKLPQQLRNPVKYRFRPILFVADDMRGRVKAFALLLHASDLKFCYLNFISAAPQTTGRGVGGALYERVREEARTLGSEGLFFECLPDDPALCPDARTLAQNARRLQFYEQYGARPIAGTQYETPLKPGGTNPPYLVFDGLGRAAPLRRDNARRIVRAILERSYGHVCPESYISMVEASFQDDPVRLREPRYAAAGTPAAVSISLLSDRRIVLVVNDAHSIHQVRERGYVESPVRITSILKALEGSGLCEQIPVEHFAERHIRDVHDAAYVDYFKRVCAVLDPGTSVYPYVFPLRNAARPPRELPVRAGYFCIDTFTPLNGNAFIAAKRSVDCALTAARQVLQGRRLAYALVRPPGHHAERRAFGGFCYFNSGAIAAEFLSRHGTVAMLDVDYHHGNGQQDIFFKRQDVLTVSIHGHPRFAYPYFSGFSDECGAGRGLDHNLNIPLGETVNGEQYREALRRALSRVARFKPQFLVVLLGLDTAKGDPTGTWNLHARDFEHNGRMIGSLRLPTVIVQEGGYNNRVLGINARNFLSGLCAGAYAY